jgi:hypothetical protein
MPGIDSGVLGALVKQARTLAHWTALTIGFEEDSFDQSHHGGQTAHLLEIPHLTI